MNFSKAENDVVNYLKQGLSNQQIADALFVTEKKIKFHLTNIYRKAKVHSRSEFLAIENNHYRGVVVQEMEKKTSVSLGGGAKPLEQGARQVQVVQKSQEDKISFIDEKFHVGETITHLHKMMKEVTQEEITPNTVNAACNCVSRLNETINTAIMAAKFLNER